MNENSDNTLIEHLLDWRKYHRFSIVEMARLVKRSKQWGFLLANGKIKKLQTVTRDAIKELLGVQ